VIFESGEFVSIATATLNNSTEWNACVRACVCACVRLYEEGKTEIILKAI